MEEPRRLADTMFFHKSVINFANHLSLPLSSSVPNKSLSMCFLFWSIVSPKENPPKKGCRASQRALADKAIKGVKYNICLSTLEQMEWNNEGHNLSNIKETIV